MQDGVSFASVPFAAARRMAHVLASAGYLLFDSCRLTGHNQAAEASGVHSRNCKAGCLTRSQRRRRGAASPAVAAGSGL